MPQFGFTFDAVKCAGCSACAVACKAEQNTPYGVRFRRVLAKETGTHAAGTLKRQPVSMACFHCKDPACVKACPTGACAKETTLGLVKIDQAKCVGCRRCAAACPYGAPQFNEETERTEKCNGCAHRLIDETGAVRSDVRPACVEACPAGALGMKLDPTGTGTAPEGFYDRTKTNPSVDFT